MKLQSVREDRKARNIKFFRSREETGRPLLTDEKKRHILLRELVEKPYYTALVDEAMDWIGERTPTLPSTIPTLISWSLDNIIKDVLAQFFERIETKAKHAVDPADYDDE